MTALDWWKGEGGNSYTQRNRVDWQRRVPFWRAILDDLKPSSVLEIGCNAGWNLLALRSIDDKIRLIGIEPNPKARREAQAEGFTVWPDGRYPANGADIVFTAGVLIHVPPDDLKDMMKTIVHTSRRHVICIEYEAKKETEIEYRGESGLLWKRPYGKLYEQLGLTILGEAHLPPESGFDNCHYWLLEKSASS